MGDATWADAASFVGGLVPVLWFALAVATSVWVLAAAWVVGRAVSRRLERRYLPDVARWSRRRAGLAEDAGPWACPACRSVNASTVATCYGCDAARPAQAPELREAATDPSVFHRPAPASQFDPSRYRGPGAPPSIPAAPLSQAAPASSDARPTYSVPMSAAAVPGFLPSLHGFRFANRWPPGPTVTFGPFDPRILGIGDASTGLCGGMVTTARDLFEAGIPPPADSEPPANGSPRFRSIVRRQVESLDWLRTPLRFFDLQAFRPDPPTRLFGFLRREAPRVAAIRDEWPKIRAEIDAGRAPILGLIRTASNSPRDLTRNHQVLAYAYDEAVDGIRIRIYDPNHPGADDVELQATVDPEAKRAWPDRVQLAQSTGEPLLGFFRQAYARPGSMAAWR